MGRYEDFDRWFVVMLPRALGVAERITGTRGDAEDSAAEAFARAFARWRTVGALPHRDGWVLRVAANLAIDTVRRRSRPPRRLSRREAPDPADVASLRASLAQALAELPPRQREAVALRYLADLPEEDVGSILGVSPGTVKSHLHRAVTSLRSRLGADVEEITGGAHPL